MGLNGPCADSGRRASAPAGGSRLQRLAAGPVVPRPYGQGVEADGRNPSAEDVDEVVGLYVDRVAQ